MPVGGQLKLKGGLKVTADGLKKKTKKKRQRDDSHLTEEEKKEKEEKLKGQGISVMSNKTYEDEFALEMSKAREGKTKSTPWGSSYRAPPEVLHGYDKKVTGKTAEERLDLRGCNEGDKFCR